MTFIVNTFILLLLSPLQAQANTDCDTTFEYNKSTYCASIEWLPAEKREQGELVETNSFSPVANKKSLPPQPTQYSKGHITVTKIGSNQPVFIDELMVTPYMYMLDGMHHPGSYSETLTEKGYLLTEMNFMKMEGCWSLRFYIEETLVTEVKISEYTNLNETENFEQMTYCEICSTETGEEGETSSSGGHSGHHDHDHD